MSRRRLVLFALTALSMAVAGLATLTPTPAEAALYQAGTLRPKTAICRCPILTGDCVCEWHTP